MAKEIPTEPKKEEKPQEANKEPEIIKTDNPNIVIINGKRVFVPNAPKREYVAPQDNRKGDRREFNKDGKKPFDQNAPKREYVASGDNKKGAGQRSQPKFGATYTAPQPAFIPQQNTKQQNKKKNEKNNYEDKSIAC